MDQKLFQAQLTKLSYEVEHLKLQVANNNQILATKEDKMSKPRKSFVHCFAIISCLLACIFQSYQVTELYLSYGVNAEAFFFPLDPIIPPLLTICIHNNYRSTNLTQMLSQPVKERFTNSFEFHEFVNFIFVNNPPVSMSPIDIRNISHHHVIKYFILDAFCYAIDFVSSTSPPLQYTFAYSHSVNLPVAFSLRLNSSKCTNANVCSVHVSRRSSIVKTISNSYFHNGYITYVHYSKQELFCFQGHMLLRAEITKKKVCLHKAAATYTA